ncbi:MAG: response regulator, partial [Actinomycetota bacterium]
EPGDHGTTGKRMINGTKPRLLWVDDEPDMLESLRLVLHHHYEVSTASSGAEALALFDDQDQPPFDVVLSDVRMPDMNGAEFLAELRARHPQVPRLLLSGHADVEAAVAAINEAKVFRFLTKPCTADLLVESISEAVEQARVEWLEQDLLDRTLNGTVDMLTDVLGLVSRDAADRAQRIRAHVHRICHELDVPLLWELDLAAMLCQLGFVAIPARVGGRESAELHERRVELTAELLIRIPRLQAVAALIRGQLASEPVRLENDIMLWSERELSAEILRLAVHFEELMASGFTAADAVDALLTAEIPSPTFLLMAVSKLRNIEEGHTVLELPVELLQPLMVLAEDLTLASGPTLAPAGMELSAALISRVLSFSQTTGVREPVVVRVPTAMARQIGSTAGV